MAGDTRRSGRRSSVARGIDSPMFAQAQGVIACVTQATEQPGGGRSERIESRARKRLIWLYRRSNQPRGRRVRDREVKVVRWLLVPTDLVERAQNAQIGGYCSGQLKAESGRSPD